MPFLRMLGIAEELIRNLQSSLQREVLCRIHLGDTNHFQAKNDLHKPPSKKTRTASPLPSLAVMCWLERGWKMVLKPSPGIGNAEPAHCPSDDDASLLWISISGFVGRGWGLWGWTPLSRHLHLLV